MSRFGTRKKASDRPKRSLGKRPATRPTFARLARQGRARDFDPARFDRTLSAFSSGGARAATLSRLLSEWIGLVLVPQEAEQAWSEVVLLLARMRKRLGPPLSLQTALLQYFHSGRGLLREPHLVPGKDLERLRLSAITDPLTGLYNRRFLSESLSRHLFRAGRSGDAVSVAVVDLQDFKSINDRFGHATGDRALVRTAEMMRGSLRPGDAACRWGGDEFVLVLPQAGCLAAVSIAERIRRRIAAEARSIRAGLTLDLYYGVASFPLDGRTADQLLAVADARLYECREQWDFDGGNRRRYPRFALDRMRLRLLAGGGFVAPVVNVGYGGLAFKAREQESVPSKSEGELSRRDQEAPRPVRIRVKNTAKLPGGRVRVGCKYA